MPPEPPPPPDEPFSTEHLRRLLDRAREAVVRAQGESSESLRSKRLLELSLTMLVDLVGRLVAAVPSEIRQRGPNVRWSALIELGHSVRHDYDRVDLEGVWHAVSDDFPVLIEEVERELHEAASVARGSLSDQSGEALRRGVR